MSEHLSEKQLARQEAIGAAVVALTSESPGNIFTKGSSRTAPPANGLIAVAHFITTGGRDYLPAELGYPVVDAGEDDDVVDAEVADEDEGPRPEGSA